MGCMHDPYTDQLAAARYRAERDQARQDMVRLRSELERVERELEDISGRESDALEWVEEQGGLGEVRDTWDEALNLCATIGCEPSSAETLLWALGECTDIVAARIMPEGMEWPRYEDGEPVRIGDEVITHNVWQTSTVTSISLYDGGSSVYYRWCGKDNGASVSGKRVKRPAPKVLDADGVEIRVGDTVWSTVGEFDGKRTVKSVHVDDYKLPYALFEDGRDPWSCMCCYLTHRSPVIAADGRPLREGEHVYHVETGTKLVVKKLPKPGEYQAVIVFALPTSPASHLTSFDPDQLTHERPVLDADGKPLQAGETVWYVPTPNEAKECKVEELPEREKGERAVCLRALDGTIISCPTRYLTHERPDTRARVIDGMDEETVERIDRLVKDGRWLDD